MASMSSASRCGELLYPASFGGERFGPLDGRRESMQVKELILDLGSLDSEYLDSELAMADSTR